MQFRTPATWNNNGGDAATAAAATKVLAKDEMTSLKQLRSRRRRRRTFSLLFWQGFNRALQKPSVLALDTSRHDSHLAKRFLIWKSLQMRRRQEMVFKIVLSPLAQSRIGRKIHLPEKMHFPLHYACEMREIGKGRGIECSSSLL